ncbi:MAG: radical SAM protein [Peptococcaceae bacterium]|nr:MAG: radical SAM protein [Peptococcaceae bacterium]
MELPAKEFLEITREKFHRALKEASSPYFAWFSLNDVCNLNCRYCFADAKYNRSRIQADNILSTAEVFDIIDNVAQAGTGAIQFAGGEPTLRNDLSEIVGYTASQGIYVALNTNGYRLDAGLAGELADAGLSQVKVSVDGLEERHDWNRGKGSFQKAMEALENFKKYGVPSIYLIMTLSRQNYEDLPALIKLALDMGINFSMVEFLPTGHSCGKDDWVLSKEKRQEAQRYLHELQKAHGWSTISFENRYIISEQEPAKSLCTDLSLPCGFRDFSVGCISGIYSYMINAAGKIAGGDILSLETGDLKKQDLSAIWKHSDLFKLLRNRDNLKGKCGQCQYRYICGGCRRRAYISTGDLMGADPGCWVNSKTCLVHKETPEQAAI